MDILDISKIKIIPSDTEIPVHNNLFPTKRAYCDNIPENSTVIDKLEAIKIITELDLDLETKPIEQCPILNYIEDLLAVFNPLNVTECNTNLFDDNKYTVIQTTEELKKLLSEILIRFDTNPKNYLKNDFDALMRLLYSSLLFLYEKETKKVTIGPKLSKVAYALDHLVELRHNVATGQEIINPEEAASTLVSVSFVDSEKLRWEEF